MRVRELMIRDVATVRGGESLARAVRLMQERDCGSVVVVDESARVAGILTDRDVCLAALESDAPLRRLRADAAMRAPVHTCAAEDSVEEAERRMGQHQVRRLPVVDAEGRLEGLLALDDVAREARRGDDLVAPPVSAESVGRTLGQIDRPHLIEGQ